MRKKVKQLEKNITSFVKATGATVMGPFSEKADEGQLNPEQPKAKNNLCASDLFSLFTADIIKADKLFVR